MLVPVVSYAASVMSFIYQPVSPGVYLPDPEFTGYVLSSDPNSVSVQANTNSLVTEIAYDQIGISSLFDDNNTPYYSVDYALHLDSAPDSLTVELEGNSYSLMGFPNPLDPESKVYGSSVTADLGSYRMPGQLLIPTVTGATYLPAATYLSAGSDIVSFTPSQINSMEGEGIIINFPYNNTANTTFNNDEMDFTPRDFEILDQTVSASVYYSGYSFSTSGEIAFNLNQKLIQGHQYLVKLSPTSSGNEILLPPDGVYTASVRIGYWGSGWPPLPNDFEDKNSVYFRNIVIGNPVDDLPSDPGDGDNSDNDTPSDPGDDSDEDPYVPPYTPTVPGSDNPTPNDQLIVNEESLKNGTEDKDKVSVDIAGGKKQVLLPAEAADIVGDRHLQLKNEQLSVEIPPGVLKKLQSLVSGEQLEGAQISFSMESVNTPNTTELLNKARDKSNTNVKAASDVYEFKLSLITADGKTRTLSQFDQPITLRLKIHENANPALLGVYYIANDGSLEYVGGELDGEEIVVNVSHFSKYAVLEYDKTFNDVPASFWASDVIKELTANHIFSGISNFEFAPQQHMTRAEIATLIVRTLGLKSSMPVAFADVDSGNLHADAIAAANEAGIIHGRSAAAFAPNDRISREEMIVMIIKAYEYKSGTTVQPAATTSYADRQVAAAWALPYIDAATSAGFVHGYSNDQFAPKQFMTRAEGAQIIYQLLKSNQD